MRRRLAACLGAFALAWLPTTVTPPHVQAATSCTGWSSTLIPPNTIRVLRTSGSAAGTVQTVNFQAYVQNALSWEYPSSWPRETLRAGAVAVKQYGWYYAMHYRGGTGTGGCYDVKDNWMDQSYRPEGASIAASLTAAARDTWSVSVTRNGSQFLTGYWAGDRVSCGSDANGVRIYQWSAYDCGRRGYTMEEILKLYYGPGVAVTMPTDDPTATFFSAPAESQVTIGSKATIAWLEETPSGAAIASRSLTLVRAKPTKGACPSTVWLPAAATWSNGGKSPQTLSGLEAGSCYAVFVTLTDTAGATAISRSGEMLVDALAPTAKFTSPAFGRTVATGLTGTVSWTESPAAGTTITSRTLTQEYAQAPRSGSCAGARWRTAWERSVASPYAVSAMGKLTCYRYRLTLKDSAGRIGVAYSGEFVTALK